MNGRNMFDKQGKRLTRYCVDLYYDNANYADVKAVLDEVDATGALIKDAIIHYVRRKDFNKDVYIQRRSDSK